MPLTQRKLPQHVLVAPDHLRGKLVGTSFNGRRIERYFWIREQLRAGYSQREVAWALRVDTGTVLKAVIQGGKRRHKGIVFDLPAKTQQMLTQDEIEDMVNYAKDQGFTTLSQALAHHWIMTYVP